MLIVAGTYPPISIDLGKDEPGMTLQRRDREGSYFVWRDVLKDGIAIKSPVDIGKLPVGRHRLV